MFIVALTGGIATGKTSVTKVFKEHGIPVVDADQIARDGKCNTEKKKKNVVNFFHFLRLLLSINYFLYAMLPHCVNCRYKYFIVSLQCTYNSQGNRHYLAVLLSVARFWFDEI